MNNTYKIEVVNTSDTYSCNENESLLSGMQRARLNLSLVGCRGGGCGICKIQIMEGEVEYEPMSKAHVNDEAKEKGFALACRVKPKGNVKIKIIGKEVVKL